MSDGGDEIFKQLEVAQRADGANAVLEVLAASLRSSDRYHELFESRLMAARHALGRPVNDRTSLDDLPAEIRDRLEAAYLDACREVGAAFLTQDRLREAWMYLRPLGDKQAVADKIAQTQVTPENVDLLVELSLHEGICPARGYELVLEHYGTCSAITMFDSVAQGRTREERAQLAQILVRHVHRELTTNLRADLARRHDAEGEPPLSHKTATIPELVADRDWLFTDLNYHIDSSHLASTVRIARLASDASTLRLASELCEYGRRLAAPYQFASEPPFRELYVDSGRYFRALLGEDVAGALEFFGAQARGNTSDGTDAESAGTELGNAEATNIMAAEVYVALLAHAGRVDEALAASLAMLPVGGPTLDLAPNVWELAARADRFDLVRDACRTRGDLLGFSAALLSGQRF
jgi:hypothetical protein